MIVFRISLIAILVLFSRSPYVYAQPGNTEWEMLDGVSTNSLSCSEAYEADLHWDAYNICLPLANEGDADAQYAIGRLYESGLAVVQNYEEAFSWYKRSAEQGNVWAQYYVAHLNYEGLGTERSYSEAYFWTEKIVKRSFVAAYYNFGLMHFHGDGVKENKEEALKWFKKGAHSGDTTAQFAYGYCLIVGDGTEKDFVSPTHRK